MAVIRLSSVDGDDGGDGSTWALAKATLAAAITAAGSGGRVLAAYTHAESTNANTTYTLAGGAECISVDPADDSYRAGASITCGPTATATLTLLGTGLWKGFSLRGGATNSQVYVHSTNNSTGLLVFENCTLIGAGNAVCQFGPNYTYAPSRLIFRNCTMNLGMNGAYQTTLKNSRIQFIGGVLGQATTRVFAVVAHYGGCDDVWFDNFDFSVAGSGATLFDLSSATANTRKIHCHRCRSNASVTIANTPALYGPELDWIESDASTNYLRQLHVDYAGTVTEDTVRVRDNSDSLYSHKLVSTAYSLFYAPLRSFPVARLNVTEGSAITVRVDVLTDNVTLTDGEFWIEANYLGSASYPLGSLASSAKANILASAANLATSSEGWTTTDLATPVKQYASVTFTPQKSGIIEIVACLAKASTTVYVDPDVTVS